MRAALRLQSLHVALGAAALVAVLLCLFPLFGTPGIESALALGLCLPPFSAAFAAALALHARALEPLPPFAEVARAAIGLSLCLVALAAGVLSLNLLRVPVCEPVEGLLFLFLGPGVGVAFAAAIGLLLGSLVPWRKTAITLAACASPISAIYGLYRFWATPGIFAYDPFVGFFPGTLYDENIAITDTYLTYRSLTLIGVVGAVAIARGVWRGRVSLAVPVSAPVSARVASLAIGGLSLGVYVFSLLQAPALGHASSVEAIEGALGTRVEGKRCSVVLPRELPREQALRLRDDCDFRVEQAERTLGVRQKARVTAFFFRDTNEKRRLMGAAETYIAKPWRDEVYLQLDRFPHPVLAHEIVHVVAGNVGRGPFRVSGPFGGHLPDPGIIEGLAVAIAWAARDDLTPHQWSRAMIELEKAPPLREVIGAGFLLGSAARSYTLSGSFLRFVLETRGAGALRLIYRSGDIAGSLGKNLDALDVEWRAYLMRIPLPADALALARARFARPGIFGQVCPREIASLEAELAGELSAGDDAKAVHTCREILAIDATHAQTRALLVTAYARQGEEARALATLRELEGSAPAPFVAAARLGLADAAWERGDLDAARRAFDALLDQPMGDDARRTLEVKRLALDRPPAERALFAALFVERDSGASDGAVAVALAHRIAAERTDGLGHYLEARQLVQRERFALARPLLAEARARGLPTERLELEARRMEALAAFILGDLEASARLYWAQKTDARASEALRIEAEDYLQRIRAIHRGRQGAATPAKP